MAQQQPNSPFQPGPQQVVGLPISLLQQLTDALRDLPHRQADPLLQQLAQCQVMDVTPAENPPAGKTK